MKKYLYNLLFFLFLFNIGTAQQTPALPQTESILIEGATIHIGNGEVINNGAVGFKDGKITYVGKASNANTSNYLKIVEASGKHIYPGFIGMNTTLGLVEIDAVRATDDDGEIGGIIPHVRSQIAYNAESKVVESVRPNGILLAQVAPRGGRISGTSSIMQLDAWNWEDATLKKDDAIHMNWPDTFKRGRRWMGEDPALKPNKNYPKEVQEVKNFITQAKAYLLGEKKPKNLPFESVAGLFDGTQKLFIKANDTKQITEAVNFGIAFGIKNMVIVGGNEAHLVTDLLANNKVAVLLSRPHRLPNTDDDNVKHPFMLATLLEEAGILTGIEMSGQMERMNTRNLPFYAGTFAAYGLAKEKAVKLITGNAAQIAGIADRAGTLQVGKDATLFVSEGDALDMRTNQLLHAFIQGREISLETHQTKLWKRYSKKYQSD
ncbi:amidohydrolase family protein [Ascidiimonas sp. W6]|uniref:amidohydrolase family protein n=1 Tax=Ascidiimonas meishanensis TaxID=3128903 RepID=UPI0030EDE99A